MHGHCMLGTSTVYVCTCGLVHGKGYCMWFGVKGTSTVYVCS